MSKKRSFSVLDRALADSEEITITKTNGVVTAYYADTVAGENMFEATGATIAEALDNLDQDVSNYAE